MNSLDIQYVLGLDLGIASVGWAIIEIDDKEQPKRLIDCGVRVFKCAEVAKTGESLARHRRDARSARRLIRRRSHRLDKLKKILIDKQVLRENYFLDKKNLILKPTPMTWLDLTTKEILFDYNENNKKEKLPIGTWGWRIWGLDHKLFPEQWAALLLHIIKHRGYLSQRKSEIETADNDLGKLLAGIDRNSKLLENEAEQYRTPAELAVKKFAIESGHIRNNVGNYSFTFNREDILNELKLLFSRQRDFGNPYADVEIEGKVINFLMHQKEALSGQALLKMVGFCTFEKTEHRAAKATYHAERFIWLSKLNNLKLIEEGSERFLTLEQRNLLINQPYIKKKLSYSQVRKILNLSERVFFKDLLYKINDNENKILIELKAFHSIKDVMEKAGLKTEWQSIGNDPNLMDEIGTALSIYKTNVDIKQMLGDKLTENILTVLLEKLNFSKFINLSLKAIKEILPLMEKGKRYDEACTDIYDSHSQFKTTEKSLLLPVVNFDKIKNPVVNRSISQTRKVINAVIRSYGSPTKIHIETGRELGKSFQDRKKIKKNQEENRQNRKNALEQIKELFPDYKGEPKSKDILSFRLYQEQHGKCLYSGGEINLQCLFESNYVEIDHVLPFSRTWDDSFNNKVLVLSAFNQNKGNKTPYEWFGSDQEKWQNFVARVNSCQFNLNKKQRILTKELPENKFIERNLNDTRYIARYISQYIKMSLVFKNNNKNNKQHENVFMTNGQITALLRARWGLTKNREENNRHHALDAIIVACTTRALQQQITNYAKYKEMNPYNGEIIDKETGEIKKKEFPKPWQFFRKEVMIRVFDDDPVEKIKQQLPGRIEAQHDYITPLFVSWAPNRKITGPGHKDTIESAKYLSAGYSVKRIPLTKFKLENIPNIIGYNENREQRLYKELTERLKKFDNNPAKAFQIPFYKTDKKGLNTQQIKSLRVRKINKSGVLLNQGKSIADADSMIRIDIFYKAGKNYAVPIYAWQAAKGILANKAVVSRKYESDWLEVDTTYQFKFSLYPNDLVEIVKKNKERIFGYYIGFDRATNSISIRDHDKSNQGNSNGLHRGIGIGRLVILKKYQVDILGKCITPCKIEKRVTL